MNFETLETSRLILRKVTPEVYGFIYVNYSDQACIDFLGLNNLEELSIEKDKFQKGISAYDRTFLYFSLIEKQTQQVIGLCGFVRHYPAHFRAEFGYALFNDSFKNKGFMSEVSQLIIDYGLEKMDLNRIEAMVGTENIPSLKIIKKLGFEREGIMKQHYLRDGVFEDSIVFGLLK